MCVIQTIYASAYHITYIYIAQLFIVYLRPVQSPLKLQRLIEEIRLIA